MLTVAECLHINEPDGPTKETRDLFVEFLTSGTVVELIEPDIFVAEHARNLHWNHGIRISGADAIHVATAMQEQCEEFITNDGKIQGQSHKLSRAIPDLKRIGLHVISASATNLLPNEYKTDDMFEA